MINVITTGGFAGPTVTVTNSTNFIAAEPGRMLADLEVQTNSLDVGLSTNWAPVAGSDATNQAAIPIDPANPSTFFRLKYP